MQRFDPEHERLALRRQAAAHMTLRGATLLGWCLWLLGAWMMTLIYGATAAVRLMMLAVMVGLIVLWPALRLSQDRLWPFFFGRAVWRSADNNLRGAGPGSVLMDWLGLAVIAQAVIWPFVFTASWTLGQTLWVDAAVLSWSLLAAALVACGVRMRRSWARSVVMLLCVGLFFGEPLIMASVQALSGGDPQAMWTMRISPIQTLWHLAEPGGLWSVAPWSYYVSVAGLAAIIAWTLVFLFNWAVSGGKEFAGRPERPGAELF